MWSSFVVTPGFAGLHASFPKVISLSELFVVRNPTDGTSAWTRTVGRYRGKRGVW